MSMGLSLSLSGRTITAQVMQQRMKDPFYEVVDFWTHAPHHTIEFSDRGTQRKIEYAFAHSSFIQQVMPDEPYGFYFGNMMILNESLLRQHPDWIPYVILKLYGEKFVEEGLDRTGRIKHYETMFRTLRVAQARMDEERFEVFMSALMRHASPDYADWEDAAETFFKGDSDIETARRNYLQKHEGNRWVVRGRAEEHIVALGGERLVAGFRNHAEVIATMLRGERDGGMLYGAALLVRALTQLPDQGALVIQPPYNGIAYFLTKDGNGVSDIVRFHEDVEGLSRRDADVITIARPFARRTLVALSKRLSTELMHLEGRVRQLGTSRKRELDDMNARLRALNDRVEAELVTVRDELAQGRTQNALALLDTLRGVDAANLATTTGEVERATRNLQGLEQLATLLGAAV